MDKSKVSAAIANRETIIHQKESVVEQRVNGKLRGLGSAFTKAVTEGVTVNAEAVVNVGQFPPGHPDEGKWAIQVIVSPFDTQELANDVADQIAPLLHHIPIIKGSKK